MVGEGKEVPMNEKPDWAAHHEETKDYPPRPLLLEAVPFARPGGRAIDLGGGALYDTRYLLEQGFDVHAVDVAESMTIAAARMPPEKFQYTVSSFADFPFPKEMYDLASGMFSLFFQSPEVFDDVIKRIKASLTKGGIFCGNICGPKDGWVGSTEMTFRTKEQVEEMLADMEILSLTEGEREGTLSNGTPKHWHLINFIARKI